MCGHWEEPEVRHETMAKLSQWKQTLTVTHWWPQTSAARTMGYSSLYWFSGVRNGGGWGRQGFPQSHDIRGGEGRGMSITKLFCIIIAIYINIILFLSDHHFVTALEKSNCDISGPLIEILNNVSNEETVKRLLSCILTLFIELNPRSALLAL